MKTSACLLLLMIAPLARAGEIAQPGSEDGAWATYDFVPGDKVLFFEDFAAKAPLKRLKAASERLDVVERQGGEWLHCRPPCSFDAILPEKLPARFTVDFDLTGPESRGLAFRTVNADGSEIEGVTSAESSPSTINFADSNNEINIVDTGERALHFSWVFDGSKVKAYADGRAALNAPAAPMARSARLRFEFIGGDDPTLIDFNKPVWITNLRVAGGGNAVTFEELAKKGRLTLRGILFDTGSDRIRPESTATIAAVAKMMAEHPDLKLVVEGHTDNQGKPEANLTLSRKRAAAVKAWLVAKHKSDASRLEPKGFGQDKPVGSNDTSEGRQANRRVELSRP